VHIWQCTSHIGPPSLHRNFGQIDGVKDMNDGFQVVASCYFDAKRSSQPLELVHSDISGLMVTHSLGRVK
jgi:hypothetical protein